MKLKQCNIKGFFAYGFSSLLFLRAEEKAVLTKGRKFLATKSKNLGASWPRGFFSKVEP